MLHDFTKLTKLDCEPERVNLQLQQISKWLEENPHVNACNDLTNLLFFLRNCKFDVEQTKRKIKCFYQMRAERIEWFSNRDPFLPELQELLNLGVFLPIDGVDLEQRKVVVIRTSAHNPKLHTQNNVFKVSKMILDLLLKLEPDNCSNGIVAIFDMHGVQLGHALQLNPKLIKRSVDSWQAYPCQPKLLEFVNSPIYVNLILNTFRAFMTAKIRSRVIVQKNNCSLELPNLPKELGGNGLSYQELATKWKQLVENNAEFYIENDKYKSKLNKNN